MWYFDAPEDAERRCVRVCAIVCGYPADEEGKTTALMKARVEKAVELWKDKRVKYLILSGGAVRNPFVEAEVMKAYAVSLGVPRSV